MKFSIRREFTNINNVCFGGRLPKISLTYCAARKEMPSRIRRDFSGLSGAFAPWAGILVVKHNRIKDKEVSFANDLYTLVHEMVHYRLWLNKKNNDHSRKFELRVRGLFVKVFKECYANRINKEIVKYNIKIKNI